MESLPEDLSFSIRPDVYKKGLPRIQKNILYTNELGETLKLIRKLRQICDYKPFDKQSKLNQEKKLAELFKNWLLFINSGSDGYSKSFIGPSNYNVLRGSLVEMDEYLSNKDIQDHLCNIIRQTNFKEKSVLDHKRIFQNVLLDLNNHRLLKKKQIDDIILDIVKKKKVQICQRLNNEFLGWLQDIQDVLE